MAVDLVGMLAAAHQVVPEALHALAQRDSRFKHSRAGGGRGGGRGPGGVRARPPPTCLRHCSQASRSRHESRPGSQQAPETCAETQDTRARRTAERVMQTRSLHSRRDRSWLSQQLQLERSSMDRQAAHALCYSAVTPCSWQQLSLLSPLSSGGAAPPTHGGPGAQAARGRRHAGGTGLGFGDAPAVPLNSAQAAAASECACCAAACSGGLAPPPRRLAG